jgi:hypothetical protein
VSVLIWAMVGIALWHFAVLVPDRFLGGIIGAFLAALFGALLTGFLLPTRGVPLENPPGVAQAFWPLPGAVLALLLSYAIGVRQEARPRRSQRSGALTPSRPASTSGATSATRRAAVGLPGGDDAGRPARR